MSLFKDHEETWHASSLAAYLRCGEAYRRRYVEHDATPPTTPQVRGSAVHRGIGTALIEQQRSQRITPVDLYEDAAAMQVDLAQRNGVTLTEEETSAGISKTFGRLKDESVKYAGTYGLRVGPEIRPVAVERRITVKGLLPGIVLKGTVDLIDETPQGEVIRDTKTTERAPNENAASMSAQLTMYALLRRADAPVLDPNAPVPVSLDFLIQRKGGIESKRLSSTRGPAHFAVLGRRIQTASENLRKGAFNPSNPETDWWCSDKWCPYWRTCPYVNP